MHERAGSSWTADMAATRAEEELTSSERIKEGISQQLRVGKDPRTSSRTTLEGKAKSCPKPSSRLFAGLRCARGSEGWAQHVGACISGEKGTAEGECLSFSPLSTSELS